MYLDAVMRVNGFTNEGLADRLMTTPSTISRWRNNLNQPNVDLLPKICKLLGCTLEELLVSPPASELPPKRGRKPKNSS